MAGADVIAAIDPVEFKRQTAKQFGATHTYPSIDEALADRPNATWNRGYNKVVMAVGVCTGGLVAQGFELAGKRGRVVVTNTVPVSENSLRLSARYNRLADLGDGESYSKLFTEDAEFEIVGNRVYRGRKEIASAASATKVTVHITMDPVIELNGDEATQRSRLITCYRALDISRNEFVATGWSHRPT